MFTNYGFGKNFMFTLFSGLKGGVPQQRSEDAPPLHEFQVPIDGPNNHGARPPLMDLFGKLNLLFGFEQPLNLEVTEQDSEKVIELKDLIAAKKEELKELRESQRGIWHVGVSHNTQRMLDTRYDEVSTLNYRKSRKEEELEALQNSPDYVVWKDQRQDYLERAAATDDEDLKETYEKRAENLEKLMVKHEAKIDRKEAEIETLENKIETLETEIDQINRSAAGEKVTNSQGEELFPDVGSESESMDLQDQITDLNQEIKELEQQLRTELNASRTQNGAYQTGRNINYHS